MARHRQAREGFTLVELLSVVAILATLAGIALGIVQGARRYGASTRARTDLSVLSQALERYRRQFGDYPQTADTPEKLYQSLAGKLGPAGTPAQGRSVIAGLPLNVKDAGPDSAESAFLDPWGQAYQYIYFSRQEGSAPLQRGYVLYSFGPRTATEVVPTRAEVVPATSGPEGGVVSTSPLNAWNIYSGP